MRTLAYRLAVLGLVAVVSVALARANDEAQVERDGYVPGEILVKFRKGVPPGRILADAKSVSATHIRSFPLTGVRHWRLPRGLDVERAVEILSKRGNVEYAEPNYVVTAHEFPDDPRRAELWGMHNLGQTGGQPDADIDALEAWAIANDASNVVVGVVDTGIDYSHEDLAANMWTNGAELNGTAGLDDDGNGIVDDVYGANFIGKGTPTGDPLDDNGHGSHTAGTIGAVGGNGKGVVGVCWKVKLMALKFLDAGGRGDTADALEAVQYAANFGVRVLNNSWGGGHKSRAFEDAVRACGALFVASAGNSGRSSPQYPAAYALDNVIAVAATDHDDVLASFSNYGDWVHLAAPGVDTLSCVRNDKYGLKSGTSMSCPHVAGAAALLIAGDRTNAQTKAALLESVDPLASLSGVVATGGRLNLLRALGGTEPQADLVAPDAVGDLQVDGTATTHASIGLTWTATGDDESTGAAFYYDLRYAASTITDATWADATPVRGEPLPGAPGATQAMVVENLDPETTYHFALRVVDEGGNASGLSNGASDTTTAAPADAWVAETVTTTGGYYKAIDFYTGPNADAPFSIGIAQSLPTDTVAVNLWDGTKWVQEIVNTSSTDGAGIDFAFAPDGTPSVSYGWGSIRFAWRRADGAWIDGKIENGRANNDYTALVYDPVSGDPTVAYRKGSDLRFARRVGGVDGEWQIETVEKAGARYMDMVYDRSGNPVIAYSDDPDGDGTLSALKVAAWNGSGWDVTTLHEGAAGFGVYASIAVDSEGNLLAADAGYSNIYVFTRGAAGWDDGTFVVQGGALSAVFDGNDVPHVGYGIGGKTYVAWNDGTGWQTEQVSDRATGRTDFGRDAAGGMGVVYGVQGGGVGLARRSP